MALTSGTKLGPYEIQSPLGSGGMGEVYRAIQSSLGRLVAIKVLPAEKVADPERKQRFVQEAKSASSSPFTTAATPTVLTSSRWSLSPVRPSTG
jgi:eukaryotic-like serine/threonine-protein kinase